MQEGLDKLWGSADFNTDAGPSKLTKYLSNPGEL